MLFVVLQLIKRLYEGSSKIIRCNSEKYIFSICVTVLVLNIHFRTPETHKMAPWVRKVFIHILPRLLNIKRPYFDKDKHRCWSNKNKYFLIYTFPSKIFKSQLCSFKTSVFDVPCFRLENKSIHPLGKH